MMNYIWGGMLLIGIIFGVVTGNTQEITEAALQSAKEAVTLSITMLGVVSFWMGFMEVAMEIGVMEGMTKGIAPFLHYLFPEMPKRHPAFTAISTNFIANVLGLGWAATPAGIQAMKELESLEKERGRKEYVMAEGERAASDEMCTFLVMNISSLQLIPVNVIAYRSQYGSVNPAQIIAPGIVATFASTIVALVICVFQTRLKRKKYGY